jgi:hypothetical protein
MARDPRSEVQPKLREILSRADAPIAARPAEPMQGDGPNQFNSMIQRIAGASVAEIDKLIGELQLLREFLMNDAQRLQRELTEYVRLNQGALESTRIVAENLTKMKAGR